MSSSRLLPVLVLLHALPLLSGKVLTIFNFTAGDGVDTFMEVEHSFPFSFLSSHSNITFHTYSLPFSYPRVQVSDTARSVGMSKAAIEIVESADTERRAVFFALLNPQPDSACFAGMKSSFDSLQDWSEFRSGTVGGELRGQGKRQDSLLFQKFFPHATHSLLVSLVSYSS